MTEALRKVSEKVVAVGIHHLRIQPDVVGEADQLVHEGGGFVHASDAGECACQPERARDECALLVLHAAVPIHERPSAELGADGVDRARHPLSPIESARSVQQDRRVETLAARIDHVGTARLRPAVLVHPFGDSVAFGGPALRSAGDLTEFTEVYRTVEGLPTSEFRRRVVLRIFEFPDAGIRLLPGVAGAIGESREQPTGLGVEHVAVVDIHAHDVE